MLFVISVVNIKVKGDIMFTARAKLNRKQGAALINVVIVLAVIMIFSALLARYFYSNLQQSKYQERVLQAYYLSQSGTDLCLTALLQEGSDGPEDSLLFEKFNPTITSPGELTESLDLVDGTVDLVVSATAKDGERWIVIESKGTLNQSNVSQTTYLEFLYENPLVQNKR